MFIPVSGTECSDRNSVVRIMRCYTRKVLYTERNIEEVLDISGIIFNELQTDDVLCCLGTEWVNQIINNSVMLHCYNLDLFT